MATSSVVPIENEVSRLLEQLGVQAGLVSSGDLPVHTPITGEIIGRVQQSSSAQTAAAIAAAHQAYLEWRSVPAPRRGELVRLLGQELHDNLPALGQLVTLETGKILAEGRGEVQEMIDICGFAAGLSRQLAGLTLPSERP